MRPQEPAGLEDRRTKKLAGDFEFGVFYFFFFAEGQEREEFIPARDTAVCRNSERPPDECEPAGGVFGRDSFEF